MPVTELAEEKFVGISTQGYNSNLKSVFCTQKLRMEMNLTFFANLCIFETLFASAFSPKTMDDFIKYLSSY